MGAVRHAALLTFAVTAALVTSAVGYRCPGIEWYYRTATDSCYYVSNPGATDSSQDVVEHQTWKEVLEECRIRGGRLLTIKDTTEFEYVKAKIPDPDTYYWIGLTFENLTWRWYDGIDSWPYVPGSIENFKVPQLDANEINREVRISLKYNSWDGTVGLFEDSNSDSNRNGFVCRGHWSARPLCKTEDGWSYHDGTCHKFQATDWDFDIAERSCGLYGGHIAVLNSDEEDKRYKNWLRDRMHEEKGWLGIKIVNKNSSTTVDQVKWLDGTPITATAVNHWATTNLANYIKNLPNGVTYCGQVTTVPESDSWDDLIWGLEQDQHDWHFTPNCSLWRPYMCETKLNKCPYGWVGFGDNCYQFNRGEDNLRTWAKARDLCRVQAGDLVSITSLEEQNFIKTTVDSYWNYGEADLAHYWIGLESSGGSWSWVDGNPLSFSAWSGDVAPSNSNDPCVFIDGNYHYGSLSHVDAGDWNSSACTMMFPYICEAHYTAAIPPDVVIHPAITCEPPFIKFHEGCYWFGRERMNYDRARESCGQKQGSTLVKINTIGENAWIQGQISQDAWVGLKRIGAPESYMEYEYSDGTAAGAGMFKRFHRDLPWNSDTSTELCVSMASKSSTYATSFGTTPWGFWYQLRCTEAREYVCYHPGLEKPRPPPDNDHWDPECGAGWFRHNRNCYRVQEQQESWQAAKQICQNYDDNSDLLYITSKEEDAFIRDVMIGNYSNPSWWQDDYFSSSMYYWIDLYAEVEGAWHWPYRQNSDKWHIPYAVSHWAEDEPYHSSGITASSPKCAAIDNHHEEPRWYSQFCLSSNPFICKKQLPPLKPVSTTPRPTPGSGYHLGCQAQWHNVNGRCMRYNLSTVDWMSARDACRRNGEELASVRSQQELSYMWFASGSWIGLNAIADAFGPRVFTWVDGSAVEYTPWNIESPTGNVVGSVEQDANCGALTSEGYAVYPCHERKPFVCEKEFEVIVNNDSMSIQIPQSEGCQKWGIGHREHCYYLGENPTSSFGQREFHSFESARRFCGDYFGGDLAVISDTEQAEFLTALMARGGADYWIGLKEDPSPWNAFKKWIDGTDVTVTNWAFGNPPISHNGATGCVAMYSTYSDHTLPGKWYVTSCSERRYALCQTTRAARPTHSTLPPTSVPAGGCPKNWATQPTLEGCYRAYRGPSATSILKLTWQLAENFCRRFHNGHLASVESEEENRFIDSSAVQGIFATGYQHWIGLKENWFGEWEWSDGSPLTIEWFHPSQDHQSADMTDCVTIDSISGRWITQTCQQAWGWICEIPKGSYVEDQEVTDYPLPLMGNTTCGNSTASGDWYYDNSSSDCIYWSKTKDTWQSGQAVCEAMNADLITVTATRYDFITGTSGQLSSAAELFWIGLEVTDAVTGRVEWVSGEQSTFTAWGKDQPRRPDRERCVAHSSGSGRWETHNCAKPLRFICRKYGGPRPVRPTGNPDAGYCEVGWVPFGRHCYYASGPQNMTWEEAHTQCLHNLTIQQNRSHSAELVSIHSSLENDFLVTLVKDKHEWDFWIGLHGGGSSNWYWSDQGPVTYLNWQFDESTYIAAQDECVVMGSARFNAGRWRKANCSHGRGFICRANKDPSLPAPPPPPASNCPDGYVQFGENVCFTLQKLDAGQNNWDAAQQVCKNLGDRFGNIATAEDVFDNAQFRLLLADAHSLDHNGSAWIGMREHGGVFSWHNSCPVVFSNFNSLFVNPNVDQCVVMDRRGKWKPHNCEDPADYVVCERRFEPCRSVHNDTDETGCGVDFPSECQHSCYRVDTRMGHHDQPRWSRESAQEQCRLLKGELASVRSVEDQRCLEKYLEHATGPMWFGLHKGANGWKWDDERWVMQSSSWVNWAPGHPRTSSSLYYNFDCAEILPNGTWVSVECTTYDSNDYYDLGEGDNRGFICEGVKERRSRRTTTLPPPFNASTSSLPDGSSVVPPGGSTSVPLDGSTTLSPPSGSTPSSNTPFPPEDSTASPPGDSTVVLPGGSTPTPHGSSTTRPGEEGQKAPAGGGGSSSNNDGLGGGAIAGIVIGVLLGVAVFVAIGYVTGAGKTSAVVGFMRRATMRVRTAAGFRNNHEQHNDRDPLTNDQGYHGLQEISYT